jgi:hypothetical protein
MKRQRTLAFWLKLSVLLSLVILPATARGQQPRKFTADSGIVTLGPNQILRITVNAGAGNDTITVRFKRMEYTPAACNANGVCKHSLSNQRTSAPLMLAPGEAASVDLIATTYGRGIVLSDSQNARVTLQIVDTTTGQTNAVLVALLLP